MTAGSNDTIAIAPAASPPPGIDAPANDAGVARQPLAPRRAPEPPAESPPPRPKKQVRKPRRAATKEWSALGSGFLSFLLIFGLAAFVVVYHIRSVYIARGPLAQERIVMIPRGAGLDGITDNLQRNGLIRDSELFLWTVRALALTGQRPDLRAGEYRFPAGASMRQIVEIMGSGNVVQHRITIPEGLTSMQIVQRLRDYDVLAGEIREVPTEGSLLPDTYLVPRGFSRNLIIQRMAQDQQRVLNDVWERRRRDLPVRTPQELVTLASIVEKETGRADERTRVAGVFVNRLNRRMRLQSDPTIIYGLVGGQGTLGRPILRSEIDRPTAFNTYVIPALPPGPIANPGRAALEATANPMRHNELYFVADGTGGHAFSETYDQHLRAVARWREVERSRGGSVSPGLDAAPAAPPRPALQRQSLQPQNRPLVPTAGADPRALPLPR